MKVVINTCYGGFTLSARALQELKQHGISKEQARSERHNVHLVDIVTRLGPLANGDFAKLKIVEIPDDVKYVIEEYDGCEWVAEEHRTWQ